MAIRSDFTVSDLIVHGDEKLLSFTIFQSDGETPQDVTGYDLSFWLMRDFGDADIVLEKTSGGSPGEITITGTYNVDPAVNTQRVIVTFDEDDYDPLPLPSYVYRLKRTDVGTTLAFGEFSKLATPRVAYLVTLKQAKDHIGETSVVGSSRDEDLLDKLAAAQAVVLDYCNTTAYWRAIVETWTETTVPVFVKQAILIQFAEFWRFRGDDIAGQTPLREAGHDLSPVVEALLRRTRDPVVQ